MRYRPQCLGRFGQLLTGINHDRRTTQDGREEALRTYVSSLMHLLSHEREMREEAKAKKGEKKKFPGQGRRDRSR